MLVYIYCAMKSSFINNVRGFDMIFQFFMSEKWHFIYNKKYNLVIFLKKWK